MSEDGPQAKPKLSFLRIIEATIRNFLDRDGFFLCAGIAYYGLFSIAPLLLLTVSIAGFFVGAQKAQTEIAETLSVYMDPQVSVVMGKLLQQMSNRASTTGTVIGVLFLVYGATRLFMRFQRSFNAMWGVRPTDEGSALQLLRARLLTFSMILLPAIILFAAVLLSTGATWLHDQGLVPWEQELLETVSPLLVIWVGISIMMLALPDVRLSLRDCWATSLLAGLACYGTTRVFGLFMAWSTNSTSTGVTAVSALMTLIVWVNVIAIILLSCVSLTRVLYEAKGKTIQPYEYARRFRVTVD